MPLLPALLALILMPVWAVAQTLCPGPREVSQVALSRTGHLLVVAIEDGGCSELVALDPLAGRLLWRFPGFSSTRVLALSRGDRLLGIAYAGQDSGEEHGLDVLEAGSGHQIAALASDSSRQLFPIGQEVYSLTFSPDDSTVYGALKLGFAGWNAHTGKALFSLDYPGPAGTGPLQELSSVDASPDGKTLALTRFHAIYLLDLKPGAEPELGRSIPAKAPEDTFFSPDGKYLAATVSEAQTETVIWDAGSGRSVATIHGCGQQIVWYLDSRSLACIAGSQAELHSLASPASTLVSAPLPPRGQLVAGAGHIVLWSAVQGQQWSDPAKPFPFALRPLGSGPVVTVMLPGRSTHP